MKEISTPLSLLAVPSAIAVPNADIVAHADQSPLSTPASIDLSRRTWPEPPHPYRSPYVRDIGRILHAKAFRRLAGKTQVFTRRSSETDHSRSRLTHTLEVAQVARTVAATLGLNAPLTEALALVHDIGHPPFGHAGEKALDEAMRAHASSSDSGSPSGFDHNLHALRIVTSFEERYPGFRGLNLTLGVREGIIKHSRDYSPDLHPELVEYFLDQQPPLEAQIIDLADEIAYLTADFEDGFEAGILDLEMVRDQFPLFAGLYADTERQFPAAETRLLSNEALKQMLNILATDLMHEISRQVRAQGIQTLGELRQSPSRIARLSPPMEEHRRQAKKFLFENLYLSPALESEHAHADHVVKSLFAAWTENPQSLPPDHQARIPVEGVSRTVADYLAGMTDAYIEQAWERHIEINAI